MPITNTLENARRLEQLGFPHEQAQGLADLFEQTALSAQPDIGDLATKADLQGVKADIQTVASQLRSEMQVMESRILRELRTQMFWFFTMLVGLLGLTVALIKFLP